MDITPPWLSKEPRWFILFGNRSFLFCVEGIMGFGMYTLNYETFFLYPLGYALLLSFLRKQESMFP